MSEMQNLISIPIEHKYFEDDCLALYENQSEYLKDGPGMVIPERKITIHITFPFDRTFNVDSGDKPGFSRFDLYQKFVKLFDEILQNSPDIEQTKAVIEDVFYNTSTKVVTIDIGF